MPLPLTGKKGLGVCFGIVFLIVHTFYFFQSLIYSLAFFNHFSSANELENGLGGLLYAILHAGCVFLGLCLFYGSREVDKDLLLTFLVPGVILTGISTISLIISSLVFTITTLQMISWVVHISFYSIVLLLIGSVWIAIPSGAPGPAERSAEDGMVQEVQAPISTKNSVLTHISKDFDQLVAKVTGFFGGIFSPKASKGRKQEAEVAPDDYVYDSDMS